MTEFARMIYLKVEDDGDGSYMCAHEDTESLDAEDGQVVARYKLLDTGTIKKAKPIFVPE